jgi:hypothetical protein
LAATSPTRHRDPKAVAKALVAHFRKYVDEAAKKEVRDAFARYDRTLLVADPRRCEPKKFGGGGNRNQFPKASRLACRVNAGVAPSMALCLDADLLLENLDWLSLVPCLFDIVI